MRPQPEPGGHGPIVVVGDALLDVDVVGDSDRLCPDAPAPVVSMRRENLRPGGAALTASLLAADHDVVLIAPLADDEPATRLRELLEQTPNLRLVPVPWTGATPVKERIRAADRTLVRLDRGDVPGEIDPPGPEAAEALRQAAAVVVSDYGRGAAHESAMRDLIADAARRRPVLWDPHPRGATPVPGVSLVTPNESEAAAFAARSAPDPESDRTPAQCASLLAGHWSARAVAVTLGERGAVVSSGPDDTPLLVPARAVDAVDSCGAGDAFAAGAASALGTGAVISEAVEHGVAAAGRFVAGGGAAGLTEEPAAAPLSGTAEEIVDAVRARGGTVVATGGCFDLVHAGHVATLSAARALGDCLVVCINSDASVRRLKGPDRPLVDQDDRARVLASLEFVDAVLIFDEDTPEPALRRLRPDIWVKGGDYAGRRLPEADVLDEWGGEAVVLPYLQGRSTTALVDAVRDGSTTTGKGA